MSRRHPRNYVPALSAEWQHLFPLRREKDNFTDEVLCAVSFLMRQIDPDGTKPLYGPPMMAEGCDYQPDARSKVSGREIGE